MTPATALSACSFVDPTSTPPPVAAARGARSLSRRSLLRTAAQAAPAAALLAYAEPAWSVAGPLARHHAHHAHHGHHAHHLSAAHRAKIAQELAHDMTGHHQGRMHGVPSYYCWSHKPLVEAGHHAHGCRAFDAWGQIYEAASGSPASNVRVSVRDIQAWGKSRKTGHWHRIVGSRGVFGYNYIENFQNDVHKVADLRDERHGAVSATLGGGYNFHFSPTTSRASIDPHDLAGIVSLYSAKVIVDDPHGPDERHLARYLASAGADYWASTTATWNGGSSNPPVGCGKARWLGPNWTTVTMSTLSHRQLAQNPPPVHLRGR